MAYDVHFDAAARVYCDGDTAALEAQVRQELDDLVESPGGPRSAVDIFFHTVFVGGGIEDGQPFMVTPLKDKSGVLVELCAYEPMGKIDGGPLDGYDLAMPMPYPREEGKN